MEEFKWEQTKVTTFPKMVGYLEQGDANLNYLKVVVLATAAVLAGCAGAPPRAPEIVRTPTAVQQQQIDVLVTTATAEWVRWGSRVVRAYPSSPTCLVQADGTCVEVKDGCGDEQTPLLCPVVHSYWRAVPPAKSWHSCGLTNVCSVKWPEGDTRKPEDTRPWSAVFVSKMLADSGFSKTEFWPSISHAGYIVPSRRLYTSAFEVVPTPAQASIGDIICATRSDTKLTPQQLDRINDGGSSPPLHCDIVVAVDDRSKKLFAIGGNVNQTVAKTEVPLDVQGRLEFIDGSARPWILILRARRGPISASH